MRAAVKIVAAGTGLALVTAGLGWWGIADWDGETGGSWVALVGITFLIPLMQTGSFLFAGICHWAFCTVAAAMGWGACLLARRALGRGAKAPPVVKPEQPPDPWKPPTAEEMARVLNAVPLPDQRRE